MIRIQSRPNEAGELDNRKDAQAERVLCQDACQAQAKPSTMEHMLRGVSYSLLFAIRFSRKFVCSFALLIAAASFASAQTEDFATLLRKAQAGDAKAQFDLASAFSQGDGVAKDPAKGIEWLKKSALQGYPGAQVVLGYMYQKGIEMDKDPFEAAKWYKKAARQGDKDPKHAQTAQTHLSEMLAQGLISEKEADWHTSAPTTKPASKNPDVIKPEKIGKSPAFSLAEVETGLKGGITTKRMATLVTTYGVDFPLSESAKKRLTDDGADDALLHTIASAKR
jgi:Sel1 repeat